MNPPCVQVYDSSSSWVFPEDGARNPELSGRTVFEGAGAMYGHFFDSPTALDVALWCETQQIMYDSPTSAPSASMAPTSAPTTTPPPGPVSVPSTLPAICSGLVPQQSSDGIALTQPQFSTRYLTQLDLVSLRENVNAEGDTVVSVNTYDSSIVPAVTRPQSFGGTLVSQYNAIRLRGLTNIVSWMNAYFWRGDFPSVGTSAATAWGELRLARQASGTSPVWLPSPTGTGAEDTYDVGSSALLHILFSTSSGTVGGAGGAGAQTLPTGWTLVDAELVFNPETFLPEIVYKTPTTLPDFVTMVSLTSGQTDGTSGGGDDSAYAAAYAGYYKQVNKSGCGTYDGTE